MKIHRRPDPRFRPPVRSLLASSGLLLAACGGGGGGSAGAALDSGTYSAADFTYRSQQPAGFHPLRADETLFMERAETFAILPHAGTGRLATARLLVDGPDAGFAELPRGAAVFGAALRSAAAGQLDADGDQELLGAVISPAGSQVELWLADPRDDGGFDEQVLVTLPVSGFLLNDARVSLANLDDDLAPECLVVGRSLAFEQSATRGRVWVLDDRATGFAPLLSMARDEGHMNLWALPADFDGDRWPEIVVALEGDTTNSGRLSARTYRRPVGGGAFALASDWFYFFGGTAQESSKALVGDFDGDRRDEIAAIGFDQAGLTNTSIRLMAFHPDATWHEEAARLLARPAIAGAVRGREWAACTVRKQGRPDAIAEVLPVPPSGQMVLYVHDHDAGSDVWSQTEVGLHQALADDLGVTVVGVDDDCDGEDEIVCGFLDRVGTQFVYDQGVVDLGNGVEFARHTTRSVPSPEAFESLPVIVPVDFDGDGLLVRSTGVRRLGMSTPIPLVLMHAPPTKAGIGQNRDASQTRYAIANSTGQSIGVTTQATVSVSLGVEAEDFTGSFGAYAKATVGFALAAAEVTTTRVTQIDEFIGSADADVIVFQGTLYESYEYEVLHAPRPGLEAAFVYVDVPVGSRIYNWTIDYYNSVMAPADRLSGSVGAHTVGDPASYPSQAQLRDQVAPFVHWQSSSVIPVGQGSGSRSTGIELATEQASEEQTTLSASFDYGFKAGYATAEASIGVERTEAYTVSYGTATTYVGTVGDILEPAQYANFHYEWGVVVCNEGQLAGSDNRPSGASGVRAPYQVICYWTNPLGSGYQLGR